MRTNLGPVTSCALHLHNLASQLQRGVVLPAWCNVQSCILIGEWVENETSQCEQNVRVPSGSASLCNLGACIRYCHTCCSHRNRAAHSWLAILQSFTLCPSNIYRDPRFFSLDWHFLRWTAFTNADILGIDDLYRRILSSQSSEAILVSHFDRQCTVTSLLEAVNHTEVLLRAVFDCESRRNWC